MKFIRVLLRKIYYMVKGQPLTDKEISERIISKIRQGGGSVGENVDIIGSSIDMGEPYLISIGNDVTITGVKILTHDASLKKKIGYSKTGKVHIGNNVFIGWGSIILPNTVIGNNVVIGAGTVVAKNIPDNVVVVGNPCRILCTYDEYLSKITDDMKHKPVIDLLPSEIMHDDLSRKQLIENGNGYIL